MKSFNSHEKRVQDWQQIFAKAYADALEVYQQYEEDPARAFVADEMPDLFRREEIAAQVDGGHPSNVLSTSQGSAEPMDVSMSQTEEVPEEDGDDLSPEMLEYYRINLEHQQERKFWFGLDKDLDYRCPAEGAGAREGEEGQLMVGGRHGGADHGR